MGSWGSDESYLWCSLYVNKEGKITFGIWALETRFVRLIIINLILLFINFVIKFDRYDC